MRLVATTPSWRCGPYDIGLTQPCVMGIVNLTPDSFSDGGRYLDPIAAIRHAERLLNEGAHVLDLGAESSRPGADALPLEQELARLLPVLREVVRFGVPISVDTYKPETMRIALDEGAAIVNDIYALRTDGALDAVARHSCGVCLMHMQGAPKTMQAAPRYGNVVDDVLGFLNQRAAACEAAGIARERIAIDPGFGFGKSQAHNLALLHSIDRFVATEFPVLIGVSRKSMIGRALGRPEAAPEQRVVGSVAAALYATARGARVMRVHDVRETVDALKMWSSIQGAIEHRDDPSDEAAFENR